MQFNLRSTFSILAFLTFSCVAFGDPIEDNSFLVEESYNQEEGVVQFIQVYQKEAKTENWNYTFINEYPFFSQTHQLSFEVPIAHLESNNKSQIEDLKLNYRNELFRNETVVTTLRLSTTLPTGDYEKGFGVGASGYETALLASVQIAPRWVQHWNVGAGITPKAKNTLGEQADNRKYFWAVSNVYLMSDHLNFMLEATGTQQEQTITENSAEWTSETIVSPSVRYAIDYNDWQFVPGLAFPTGLGPTEGSNQILGYLSIEGKMF